MRRRMIGAILGVGMVASLGTTMAVAANSDRTPPKLNGPAMTTATSTATSTVLAAAHAASLPGGRWTSLPAAPIVGRSGAVGIWTGQQMLVWGGANLSGSQDYADGASYDPTTRRWAILPPAPLSARSAMTSVWTGHVLFIWGGTDARGHTDNDGALYDPATRRWTTLAAPAISAHSSAQATWTGTQILLLTAPPGRTSNHLTLQAYAPSTGRWGVLPTLQLPPGRDNYVATAVQAGNRLFVWSNWAHTTTTPGGFELTFGINGYSYDPRRHTWAPSPFPKREHDSVDQALWTGRQVLIPASQIWCGLCPGPYNPDSAGVQLTPRTGSVRTIPHGPADDLGGTYLWTGSVLLAMNTTSSSSGGGQPAVDPGRIAYWQPATNRWTRLASAPLAGSGAVTVWTGRRLLIWGQLSPIHANAPRTAGIELG